MGLFDFKKKRDIQDSAYKIGMGIKQIENEWNANAKITPLIDGIASALKREVKELERLLQTNGRTDWNLYNSLPLVRWHDGTDIPFSLFIGRLNSCADLIRLQTGFDFGIWL